MLQCERPTVFWDEWYILLGLLNPDDEGTSPFKGSKPFKYQCLVTLQQT
jgi:hypothetical protein